MAAALELAASLGAAHREAAVLDWPRIQVAMRLEPSAVLAVGIAAGARPDVRAVGLLVAEMLRLRELAAMAVSPHLEALEEAPEGVLPRPLPRQPEAMEDRQRRPMALPEELLVAMAMRARTPLASIRAGAPEAAEGVLFPALAGLAVLARQARAAVVVELPA